MLLPGTARHDRRGRNVGVCVMGGA
jgi:hypothetical protein